MRIRLLLLVPLFVATAALFVSDALRKGEEALIQRQYEAAVGHLQQALTEAAPAERDRVLLLLGRAQALLGRHDDAVATFRRLVAEVPGSALADKAMFQSAEAHAAARRMQEAAEIYRGLVERLVGLERKEEIAATYLGLAEKAAAKDPPDHARAVTFYDLALDLGLRDERARKVRLLAAEAVLAAGDAGAAIQRLQPLVDQLPKEHGRQQAMLALGRAKARAGDRPGARAVLRDAIALDPTTSFAGDSAWEIALTFGVPNPAPAELDRAVAAIDELAKSHPQHPQAKLARFLIARCYQAVGRSEAALAAVREFLADPRSAGTPELAHAMATVGDLLYAQARYAEAITAWQQYLKANPAHEAWERVHQGIVDAEFQLAADAMRAGKTRYGEARERFEAFMAAHPLDPRNPDVLAFLGDMLLAEEQFDAAREAYARCVAKYPGREPSSRAQFMIGELFESRTFDFLRALEAYKKVTWGSWAPHAQQRIARLTRKHLALFTPRTFRSGEPARFELTSRNIEQFRVRVWRLDLETYFRSRHTAGDVACLDIEVIQPDHVFDWKVDEYKQYRETKREVGLGLETTPPGAYIVKVDDQELEATTLVVVSDVGLITKSSRHELLVFAQNLKEERPQAGVRVVVSDGHKAIAEGTTGGDGIWRLRSAELKNVAQLVVFGVDASGSGASTLDLSGLGYSEGLTPKAYLFTDRPAYEPGQVVHWKGIVREVRGGLYELPAAGGYRVSLLSASGRLLLRRQVEFTPFGSFASDFALPEEAELGSWRITLEKDGGANWSASFEVARYERPRLLLRAEATAPVVYRGEAIRGFAELKHFHGGAAAERELELTLGLPDGGSIVRRATTNASGRVEFEFPTLEFAEEAVAVVTVRAIEANVATELTVPVVTTELTAEVTLLRPVYLAGETFDARVRLLDRAGKPLVRKATLTLLRLEQRDGRTAEVEVAAKTVETGADGRATAPFTAAKGGRHVVRLVTRDRFGADVTGQVPLEISGQDDEIKLRLLTDRQSWKVGQTATFKVANRAGRHLALRTIQGDGILAADTIVVPAGESTLELPLEALHAPNFALALSMIDGTHLHVAQRDLEVARDLSVTLRAPAAAKPGEEVDVEVEARDPFGRPAAAEFAVSLVDRSLLALFPDATPPIGQFFFSQRRETEFRTASSCGWNYHGPSRAVNAALLAEERRAEAPPPAEAAGDVVFFAADPAANATEMLRRLDELSAGSRVVQSLTRDARPGLAGPVTGVGERVFRLGESPAGGGAAGRRQGGRNADKKAGQNFRAQLGFELKDRELDRGYVALDAARPSDQPRSDFSETGAWLSAVVTGADGKARARIKLPESLTSWQLVARGVTVETHAGAAEQELATRKDLVAGLELPPFLAEGDKIDATIRLENLSARDLDVAYDLAVRHGARESKFDRRLAVGAGREGTASFPLHASASEPFELTLAARGGDATDAVRHRVAVLPFGAEFRSGASGRLDQPRTLTLGLPGGREYLTLQLQLEVGPAGTRELLRIALGHGIQPWNRRPLDSTLLATASNGLGALYVLDVFERDGLGELADLMQLRALLAGSVGRLAAAQNADGSCAWVRGQADFRTTAQALALFAGAARRGIAAAEQPANRAAEWLIANLARVRPEHKLVVLEALSLAGRARFEDLNAAHRGRASLDPGSLARLALAWQAHGRAGLAGEALQVLATKFTLPRDASAGDVEAVALAATALLQAAATDRNAAAGIEWLEARRAGSGWQTPEATAAALRALCAAGGFERAAANVGEVDLSVNGQSLPATFEQGVFRASAPAAWLKPAGNEIRLAMRGRGKAQFVATLTGFAKGFDEKDRRRDLFEIRRFYAPAPLREGTQVVPPGFSIVTGRDWRSWRNAMRTLEAGRTGLVETSFWAQNDLVRNAGPLVLEEPIPAGCSVPRDSVQGSFDHLVVTPDRLIAYYREGRHSDTIRYELLGRYPGEYRAAPPRVYAAAQPELLAYGTPSELTVNPRGTASADPHRLTPDELYRLGKLRFDAGDKAGAAKLLEELLRDWQQQSWQLRDETFKDVVRMLLFAAIAADDSQAVVRWFESLTERHPDLVIPFGDIVRVGKAYADVGEFERALQVFRATAEASYLKEAAVATTLEQLGEIKASVQFLRRLLLQYPDLNTIRLSLYGVGQKLASLAAAMPDGAAVDDRVGRREELRGLAVRALREFLVLYPEDPLADEVAFAWATTHVEARELDQALAVAGRAIETHPRSPFLDELLYTVGFVQFAKGEHEQAFRLLERVVTENFPRRGGGDGPSENRDAAIYLQGQIHHALGRPEQALAAYDRVKEQFSDAVEAREYFLRKALSLPEVTTCRTDAKPSILLSHRNLTDAELKVYRVDLMRLYLLEKSLDDIRGILLHGIRPLFEQKLALGDGRDWRTRETKVDLTLDAPGAYLVVARGGDLLATGMLLRTDLQIETQESPEVGRIRVNVKRGDAYLAYADVKVVGSGDGKFQGGETDLRGVYTAGDLVGHATVIVRHGDQFAFHRGEPVHQPARMPAPAQTAAPLPTAPQQQEQGGYKSFDPWRYNLNQNAENRSNQIRWLQDEVMNKQQKGVEVQRTK